MVYSFPLIKIKFMPDNIKERCVWDINGEKGVHTVVSCSLSM